MPAGLMIILVIYLLRDVPSSAAPTAVATIGASITHRGNAEQASYRGSTVRRFGGTEGRLLRGFQKRLGLSWTLSETIC